MKLEGATYMDVHKAGGGINFTVKHTRESSKDELKELCRARFDRMLRLGTTLVEAKSGYGLDVETEMKMLEVIHEVSQDVPIDVVGTYLAHSVPRGMAEKDAADKVVNEQIPEMIRLKALGKISPELCDVFHEKGVFEGESALRILQAGKDAGLELNFHGDELHPMGSCELGAELGALAVSHVEHITEDGIRAMVGKKCIAVVLPTTFFILRITPPPVRNMIEAGVPLALASDFNPNAHCMSMPFVMLLGCVQCHMTLNEALVAVTINAAASINRSKTHGSIEVGKMGDFVIVNSPRWEHIVYEMTDPPITHVIKLGKIVH
jgi:imidazolonepropionase